MDVEWLLPATRYGERWREGRKIADRSLRPGAMSLYHQRVEEKTRAFLNQLLASPADFRGRIELSVVRFISLLLARDGTVSQITSETYHVSRIWV